MPGGPHGNKPTREAGWGVRKELTAGALRCVPGTRGADHNEWHLEPNCRK
jgi:hypothetical protein